MAFKMISDMQKLKGGKIEHRNIRSVYVRKGQEPQDYNSTSTYNADVDPKGGTLRVFGTYGNRKEPVQFDREFKVGETVIYDSYNLIYTGTLQSIGPATVTVEHHGDISRLRLDDFINRNWDLDLARVSERNYDTSMHI